MESTTAKIPLSDRINLRMIVFIVVIGFLVGYPTWVLIETQLTGGVTNAGGGYLAVKLKSLGNFEFDEVNGTVNDVPPEYRKLDGKDVLLEGEMYAENETAELHKFQLVYSIAKCCFNGPPKVQERVFCVVPNGGTALYSPGYNRVKGTLHIATPKDGGKVSTVFTLDVKSVEPSP